MRAIKGGKRWTAAAAVLGAVAFGAAAGPAFGSATVTFHPGSAGRLTYQALAGDGVPSALSITFDAGTGNYRVRDLFETLTAGVGCHAVDTQTVDCHAPFKRPVRRVIAHMEDGNDIVSSNVQGAQLFGGPGNDTMVTDDGVDSLNGGPGDDRLFGHGGPDLISGGNGKDTIEGGAGDDIIGGGAGKDTLKGEGGKDVLNGGLGDDFLDGGSGADRIFGGDGDDTLHGENGHDLLKGGKGDDALHSRDGSPGDTDDCGAGHDSAIADPGDAHSGCESFHTH
jgi:Ca2+-binding RTX toxin-like protein